MTEMTLAAALELPVLRRGLPKVVAGAGHLHRPIRWVHAGEVPNMASMLRGGELLLTTGMGIAETQEQREFIAELASRAVAGLVIELGGTFATSLPEAMARTAEELGLPLIELHAAVRFVAVTEAIHTEIVNRDYEMLRRADKLHRSFTASMLSGEGVPGVLALLAQTLGNPVFLEAHDGRLLAHASPGQGSAEDLVATWSDSRRRPSIAGLEVAVGSGRAEGEARLVALPAESAFDRFAPLALERAADTVALALLRSRQEEELLVIGHGHLLTALVEERIDPELAATRAAGLGLRASDLAGFLPVAARMTTAPSRDGGAAAAPWTGALRDLDRELAAVGAPTLVGADPLGGNLYVLVGLKDAERRSRVARSVAKALRAAAGRAGREIVVAVGGICDWTEVSAGLRDAIDAAALSTGRPAATWIDATAQPLDLLLWRLGDQEVLRRYVDTVIGPLIRHDAQSRHKLLPTLEALCRQGGRRAVAARSLSLNRQALYGRIERLERLLDVDLSNPETLTALDVAVRARRRLRGHDRG